MFVMDNKSYPSCSHTLKSKLEGGDVVRYPHGQEGVPSPGGPSCLAHARDSLGQDAILLPQPSSVQCKTFFVC